MNTVDAEHLAHLDGRNFLLGRVVARAEALALREDAQHGWISTGYPAAKRVASDEHDDPSQQTFKEIENADGSDTDEIEEGSLDAQIGEGLMQALEDAIATFEI